DVMGHSRCLINTRHSTEAPGYPLARPPFPTRRSSDLHLLCTEPARAEPVGVRSKTAPLPVPQALSRDGPQREHSSTLARQPEDPDRKSTRLNSSHVKTSYAVFCMKKKKEPEKGENPML